MDVPIRRTRYAVTGGTLPSRLVACLPVYHREAGQSSERSSRAGYRYLFRYQNSGVAVYWVRFSNAVGSVAEMVDFHAQV